METVAAFVVQLVKLAGLLAFLPFNHANLDPSTAWRPQPAARVAATAARPSPAPVFAVAATSTAAAAATVTETFDAAAVVNPQAGKLDIYFVINNNNPDARNHYRKVGENFSSLIDNLTASQWKVFSTSAYFIRGRSPGYSASLHPPLDGANDYYLTSADAAAAEKFRNSMFNLHSFLEASGSRLPKLAFSPMTVIMHSIAPPPLFEKSSLFQAGPSFWANLDADTPMAIVIVTNEPEVMEDTSYGGRGNRTSPSIDALGERLASVKEHFAIYGLVADSARIFEGLGVRWQGSRVSAEANRKPRLRSAAAISYGEVYSIDTDVAGKLESLAAHINDSLIIKEKVELADAPADAASVAVKFVDLAGRETVWTDFALEGRRIVFTRPIPSNLSTNSIVVTYASKPEPALTLVKLAKDEGAATNAYSFKEFNLEDGSDDVKVFPDGSEFYEGTFTGSDGYETRVYVVRNSTPTIDRALFQINGGTGTEPRFFIADKGDHKAVIMLSMRGLHTKDFSEECAGASVAEYVNCLKTVSWLPRANPAEDGRSVVELMRLITGVRGVLTVDGKREDKTFFGVGDPKFNVETGSYGATILAYALADPEISAIGRIFIDGPSSPSELVITDGFRNFKVALRNILAGMGMSAAQIDAFIDVLKSRHDSPSVACDAESSARPVEDCLSSGMLWEYIFAAYDDAEDQNDLDNLKNELLAVEASGSTNTAGAIDIYDKLGFGDRMRVSWASNDLLDRIIAGGFLVNPIPGFTSRIGQICSAYVLRKNGDSRARFDAAKADPSNDPYWYGFLINYRQILDICPQIADNIATGISVPDIDEVNVDLEALVQYGAGGDEKHHIADIQEMEGYIGTGIVKSVIVDEHLQGGGGIRYGDCFNMLYQTALTTELDGLRDALDSVAVTNCGQQ